MRDAGVKALRTATGSSSDGAHSEKSCSLAETNPTFLTNYPDLPSVESKFAAEPVLARRFRKMWLEIMGADKLCRRRFGDAARHFEDILAHSWDHVAGGARGCECEGGSVPVCSGEAGKNLGRGGW